MLLKQFCVSRYINGYTIIIASFLIQMVGMGAFQTFGIFFKPILHEFNWDRAITSGAFSLSWFMQGLLAVLMGKLTDSIGPRMVITLCGAISGVSFIMMSMVSSVLEMYFVFGIIGIGLSGFNVSLMSTVARWFAKNRGIMTGLVMAGGGMGTFVMPLFAYWLISEYGWRESYIILGIFVLIIVILSAQLLRHNPEEVNLSPLGVEEKETLAPKPLAPSLSFKEAIRTLQIWIVFAIFFCLGFIAFGLVVHIVPYATDVGIPASMATKVLSAIGGFAIVGRIVMGLLGDRVGILFVLMLGYLCIIVSVTGLLMGDQFWVLFSAASLFGFSWGIGALGSPLVAQLFGLSSHGVNLGFVNFGYSLGAAAGPYLLGVMFDLTGMYRSSFKTVLAMAVLGFVLAISLKSIKVKL